MIRETELLATVLSCPSELSPPVPLADIAASHLRAHLAGFLRRRGDAVRARSEGLVAHLEGVLAGAAALPHDASMAFPAPAIIDSLTSPEVDPVWVAARLAAHFHGLGQRGTWSAQLAAPRTVRFGHRVTPAAAHLVLDGDALHLDGRATTVDALRTLGVVEVPGGHGAVWLAGADDAEALSLDPAKGFSAAPLADRVTELRAALEAVARFAPEYLPWIGGAVRVVAGWPGSGDKVMSGSVPGQPGVVYVSSPLSTLRVAESLIHEAAHQYFHIGELHTRFHTLADAATYWSPYVQKERPIDRILLAYHAFANVSVFYQRVLAGTDDAATVARARFALEQHRPHLHTFREVLERSPGITAPGRALHRTLAARLAA